MKTPKNSQIPLHILIYMIKFLLTVTFFVEFNCE